MNIGRTIIKRIKYPIIILLVVIFVFSDFISFLPSVIQNNKLTENFKIQEARAAANGDGLIFYGLSGNTAPQIRAYDNVANSFSAATGTLAGAQPVIVRMKSSPTKEEFIAAYQDNTGSLRVMCYDGAAWSNEWSVAVAPSGTPTTRRFDIAYETNSGDVTIAYSRNAAATNALAFRTKSGAAGCGAANWSAAANFPTTSTITTGTVQWVKADKDGRSSSNLSGWIWADSSQDLGASVWSGTAFGNLKLLETTLEIIAAAQDVDSFDIDYESISGDLMVVWGSGGANGTNGAWYNMCVGGTAACTWNAARTAIPSLLDDATVLDLSADPTSDRLAFASIGNAGSDLQAAYWSGSAWSGYPNIDTSTETPLAGMRLTQTGWITNGATTKWVLTYDDSTGTGIGWFATTPGTALTSTAGKQTDWVVAPLINDIRGRYEMDNNPFDTSQLMLTLSDSTNSIFAKRLSMDAAGTLTWTNADGGASLGAKFSHPQQGFSFTYRRFIPIPTGPDATSISYQVGGDGARSGYSATITGTNFGTASAGSRANCAGGAGTGCIRFIVGGNATVADADVTAWSSGSITFTVNANLASYGGLASLQVVSAGNADPTPLNFYIYPNITSAPASGQIGDLITISGDHFGASAGTIKINNVAVTPGGWNDIAITNVKVPGQTGVINGQIEVIRSVSIDSKNDLSNFTILAPSVLGSAPASSDRGQNNFLITFNGLGIDTDEPGTAPILKLRKGLTREISMIPGTYSKVSGFDYVKAEARFDLTGVTDAEIGYWRLEITNMDGNVGTYGNETASGFYIGFQSPVINSISPGFGLNSGVANITYIEGDNFLAGATAKLTKGILTPINQLSPFSIQDYGTYMRMENGSFEDLSGKTLGWWNVVVTNPDLQSGSYGNETNSGFQIISSEPVSPSILIQSKIQGGASISVGEGVGGQTTIWFGMDMAGGKTNESYYSQVEVQPNGAPFECDNNSLDSCVLNPTGFFAEGSGIAYNGTPVQGWVSIDGVDGASYHWQARVRNSAGRSNWVSFGNGNPEGETDIYIDNTAPTIDYTSCADAAPSASITDLSAIIQWNTTDAMSGGNFPTDPFPSGGIYAKVQVDYKKGTDSWSSTALSSWEVSPHQVNLSGLTPATNYTFKMKAQDYLGNEKISSECSFTTTSSRPIKTVEFFIDQETAQNAGTQIAKNFSVYIPESPGGNVSVKSAFIEISGVTNADAAQSVNMELKRRVTEGDVAVFDAPGTSYAIDSASTITPFVILFDALNPNTGEGNQNMANIAAGASNYYYTLFLNGNGTAISVFSAKLIITYSYAL